MDSLEVAYQEVVRRWRERRISSRAQLADALSDYRVRFAYNSGNIENPELTYHDTRDVFEDGGVRSFSGDPRTLFEIQNLKGCHELVLDAFEVRRPIDEPFLLEVHRMLTQGTYDERRYRQWPIGACSFYATLADWGLHWPIGACSFYARESPAF